MAPAAAAIAADQHALLRIVGEGDVSQDRVRSRSIDTAREWMGNGDLKGARVEDGVLRASSTELIDGFETGKIRDGWAGATGNMSIERAESLGGEQVAVFRCSVIHSPGPGCHFYSPVVPVSADLFNITVSVSPEDPGETRNGGDDVPLLQPIASGGIPFFNRVEFHNGRIRLKDTYGTKTQIGSYSSEKWVEVDMQIDVVDDRVSVFINDSFRGKGRMAQDADEFRRLEVFMADDKNNDGILESRIGSIRASVPGRRGRWEGSVKFSSRRKPSVVQVEASKISEESKAWLALESGKDPEKDPKQAVMQVKEEGGQNFSVSYPHSHAVNLSVNLTGRAKVTEITVFHQPLEGKVTSSDVVSAVANASEFLADREMYRAGKAQYQEG
ncbi:MAG: hypothetical protein ABEI07_01825, partial [Candidatus Nanohaloarchaea archaeon]